MIRVVPLEQTVEKPRVQPEKTVPRELGNFRGTVFPGCPRLFHSKSDPVNPVGPSWTCKTLKSLKQKPKVQIVPREQPGKTVGFLQGSLTVLNPDCR